VDWLNSLQQRFFEQFLERRQNAFAITVFCKTIVAFVMVAILMEWSVSAAILNLHGFSEFYFSLRSLQVST
jgi:hypothetical protein